MAFSLSNLGCNSNHLSPGKIQKLGYGFIETSLSKQKIYPLMVRKMLMDLDEAKAMKMPYAIHLPVYLTEHWQHHYDFYDAYYLDPDPALREMAFHMLEENLSRLSKAYAPMYYVIHFPGIYGPEACYEPNFEQVLETTLSRLSALAEAHDCLLALEYFATNAYFTDYKVWLKALAPYPKLKPLLDTGHLFFSCYRNGYTYEEVLRGLAPHCVGFHLWNVYGEGYYGDSKYYQKYHHIVPHLGQSKATGWAFDPAEVIPFLAQFNKPMLVEAGQRFEGETYFLEGLVQIREMLRKGD